MKKKQKARRKRDIVAVREKQVTADRGKRNNKGEMKPTPPDLTKRDPGQPQAVHRGIRQQVFILLPFPYIILFFFFYFCYEVNFPGSRMGEGGCRCILQGLRQTPPSCQTVASFLLDTPLSSSYFTKQFYT